MHSLIPSLKEKKLNLGADKCLRIHISKKADKSEYVPVKVNTEAMKNSEKEIILDIF